MKVRIEYTVEVTDEERLALGDGKPAGRDQIRKFFGTHGTHNARQQLQVMMAKRYDALATEYAEKAKQLKDE